MRHFPIALALILAVLVAQSAAAAEVPRENRAPAASANATRTTVFVAHTGSDAAGLAFITGLRSAIQTSTQFRLVESEEDASVLVVVVSVSPSSTSGVASAISLAYVANNEWRSLLGTAARFVGRDRANAMGRATLSELSTVLAAYSPTAGQSPLDR